MYGFFYRRLGRSAADVLTGIWYAALIVLVFYCAFEPQAELKYLAL